MRLGLFVLLSLPLPAADYLFTQVTINGAGPFRLLVDTGASSSSLDPEAARLAGLVPRYAVQLTTFAGEAVVPAAIADRVQAGEVRISNVEIMIHQPDAIRSAAGPVHGVLGQSFLSRAPWLMDYSKREFVTGEEARKRATDLPEVPREVSAEDSRLVLPVQIGQDRYRLALDSGASHMVLQCAGQCPRLEDIDPTRQILTSLGRARATLGRLKDVSAGPVAFRRVEAVLVASQPLSAASSGVLPASWFRKVFSDPVSGTLRLGK